MNAQVMNYAYLAGYLESELKALAYDKTFLSMDTSLEREDYLRSRIKIANDAAATYAARLADA